MKRKAFAARAAELAERFTTAAPAILTFSDPEDLHQLRVSGRSLLACLSLLPREGRSLPEQRSLRQAVRKQMRLLGTLRDIDVLLEELGRRKAEAGPGSTELLAAWEADLLRERAEARRAVAEALPEVASPQFQLLVSNWLVSLRGLKRFNAEKRLERLRKNLKASLELASVEAGGQVPDDALLDRLHEARIQAKKLRYALAVTGTARDSESDWLKALQDLYGKVQDRRVWLSRLEPYRAEYPAEAGALAEKLKAEMVDLLSGG